uniref:Uncharacterized protein n=1 Tax=Megaviridae environmental sample TaxID=1737588 RepID=A0A5J6VJX9_9VIRU|nr:MAG: hypothetical protein [Megaviridae environmental sample]
MKHIKQVITSANMLLPFLITGIKKYDPTTSLLMRLTASLAVFIHSLFLTWVYFKQAKL